MRQRTRSDAAGGEPVHIQVIYIQAIYVSWYCYICVLILLCMRLAENQSIYRSCIYRLYMCPHTVHILLYMCPHTEDTYCYICVLILLYIGPHTALYVSSHMQNMCPHTAMYVSSYCYICGWRWTSPYTGYTYIQAIHVSSSTSSYCFIIWCLFFFIVPLELWLLRSMDTASNWVLWTSLQFTRQTCCALCRCHLSPPCMSVYTHIWMSVCECVCVYLCIIIYIYMCA